MVKARETTRQSIIKSIEFVGFYCVRKRYAHHEATYKLLKIMEKEGLLESFNECSDYSYFRKAPKKYNPLKTVIVVNGVEVKPVSAKFDPNFDPPTRLLENRPVNRKPKIKVKVKPIEEKPVEYWDKDSLGRALMDDEISYAEALEIKHELDKGGKVVRRSK